MWQVKAVSLDFGMLNMVEARYYLLDDKMRTFHNEDGYTKLWHTREEARDVANSLNGVQFGTLNIGDMFYRNGNQYIKVPQYTHMSNKECNVFWRFAEQWWPHNCVFCDDIYVLPCERE